MKLRPSDTIAAIATALGGGAISIVRVSGPGALLIVDKAFRGTHRIVETPGFTIRYGQLVDENNEVVDEVLASVFRAPNSYTGENSVEITCHGGSLVTKLVLKTLLRVGARQADPGEFTKRAFLNGKMDLVQAEAVSDVIMASSERGLRNSAAQLRGRLGDQIRLLSRELTEICSLFELQLDFSEDNIPITSVATLEEKLLVCRERIQSTLSSFVLGKILKDGVSVAIVGRPNVGKSSLFNRLLKEDRSIVSSTPGTTRDFLEESIMIEGIVFSLFDTAGLRIPVDMVEAEGISRTKDVIKSADIILLVLDAGIANLSQEELDIINEDSSKLLIVENKTDLATQSHGLSSTVRVSSLTGDGFDNLKGNILKRFIDSNSFNDSSIFISSSRQREALAGCLHHIDFALNSLRGGMPNELITVDLRSSLSYLSEIVGEITTDDILNSIFSSFCIGK